MKPEHAQLDESASDAAFRWAIVAIIIVAIGVLTYSLFTGDEMLGSATIQVAPQYLQDQPASS
jgi:hypothetical protein